MADTNKLTKSRAPRASNPKKTANTSQLPSAHVSAYTVGDYISHPMFGNGSVRAVDDKKLTIEFLDGVTKQVIDDYVKHRRP